MATARNVVRKSFIEVSAPMTSAKLHVYCNSADEMVGKTITLDMTRALRGKSFELVLRLEKDGDKLIGQPISLSLAGSFIRRSMRKSADYVEDSFIAETKEGKVRIKPFMITRSRVSRAVLREIRSNARKLLEAYVRIKTPKELFSDLMTNKIQKELSMKLKKVYPLAFCEIRVFEIVQERKQF
jgi:ribosomal protein S3AE